MADLSSLSTEQLIKMRSISMPAADLSKMSTEDLMKMRAAPRSAGDELKRQAGLTVRAVGPLAAGALAGAAMGAPLAGVGAIPGALAGAGAMSLAQLVDNLAGTHGVDWVMNKLGVPKPETPTERVVGDMTSALAGTAGVVSVGGTLAKSASPVVSKVGEVLQSQPALQAISSVFGGAGSGIARESGAGPGGQMLAGVGAAAVPAVVSTVIPMAVRGVMRGGESGRQNVADNIKLFKESGYGTPTVGQATEGRLPRAIESTISKAPGGAGIMVKTGEKGAANLGDKVDDIASGLAKNSTATKAGATIEKGIASFVAAFRAKQKFLYDKLDKYVAPDTQVPANNVLAKISEISKPIAGAEETSALIQTPRLAGTGIALAKDVAAKPSVPILSRILGQDGKPIVTGETLAQPAGIPYQALKELRTAIGAKISNPTLADDVPTSQWKQIYVALSDDLKEAAKKSGPGAERAFNRANIYTKAGHERIDTFLSRVTGKDTVEKIFNAAVNPSEIKEGASTVNAVMRSLPKSDRPIVQAAFIRRLGTALAGKQNEVGDTFSTETFLTNWNKISPAAKMILFADQKGTLSRDLDKIAKVAANLREGSKVFSNPSGTAQGLSAGVAGGAALVSLLSGNPGVAVTIGGAVVSADLGARLMTNANFVRWLAKATQVPIGLIPAELNVLARISSNSMDNREKEGVDEFIKAAKQAELK